DAAMHGAVVRALRFDTELLRLPDGLSRYRERRQDQDRAVRLSDDVLRPDELHRRLAECAVREQGRASLSECPFPERALEVEQEVREPQRVEAGVRIELSLRF